MRLTRQDSTRDAAEAWRRVKEFFLILFFAKSVLITPEPIDIEGSVTLQFLEPVSAITGGANIRIDVTGTLPAPIELADAVAVLDYLEARYPDGSVNATLTTAAGQTEVLNRLSGSTNGKNAELVLSSATGVSTDLDFTGVEIVSTTELKAVIVTWQNHAK